MYKRQEIDRVSETPSLGDPADYQIESAFTAAMNDYLVNTCLLYTSDAADERSSVDLGGRRIIKKKNMTTALDLTSPTAYYKALTRAPRQTL